jgi:hypothetical protein
LKPVPGDDAVFLVEKIGVSSSKDIWFQHSTASIIVLCFCITLFVASLRLYIGQANVN